MAPPGPLGSDGQQQTTLVKPRTKRGKRVLEKRAPKLVEDAKRALFLYGGSTSGIVKDVLTDLHKLKGVDAVRFTRKNDNVKPFEPAGEAPLEFFAQKSNCSLFALGSHTKKRPHNITLGRLFDFHLYDCLELGVERHRPIKEFGGAASAQAGNKPVMLFVGERFESVPEFKLAKSLLLDFFRGLEVDAINLAGLDRIIAIYAAGDVEQSLLLRQYRLRLKKGTNPKVPRVSLEEMGPALDMIIRRTRLPGVDMEREAMKRPQLGKKKEKNVGRDTLDGKVGRIYMPKQTLDTLGLSKMKGLKRERRQAAAAAKAASSSGGGGGEAWAEAAQQQPAKRRKQQAAGEANG